MKKFSRFEPFGLGGQPGVPLGERIYRASLEAIGFDDNFANDENLAGELYAESMIAAAAVRMCAKAKAELHPLSSVQFLALQELENGTTAIPGQTALQRQRLLYTLRRLNLDGRLPTIVEALQELLGSDLVGYRTKRVNELGAKEKVPNPAGNQSTWDTPLRVVKTSVHAARLGVSLAIPVEFVGGDPDVFSVGSSVVIDAGSYGRSEVVTVLAATSESITVKLTKPHDAGSLVVSGHHPRHWSTKRNHLIWLRNGKAQDQTVRGTIEALMRRLVKGSATWAVLDETTPFTSGPFRVGEGLLGTTTIGATSL